MTFLIHLGNHVLSVMAPKDTIKASRSWSFHLLKIDNKTESYLIKVIAKHTKNDSSYSHLFNSVNHIMLLVLRDESERFTSRVSAPNWWTSKYLVQIQVHTTCTLSSPLFPSRDQWLQWQNTGRSSVTRPAQLSVLGDWGSRLVAVCSVQFKIMGRKHLISCQYQSIPLFSDSLTNTSPGACWSSWLINSSSL